ncbi:MAG: HAD family hydrolase [Candidatus Bathyarchaeia archaeon]
MKVGKFLAQEDVEKTLSRFESIRCVGVDINGTLIEGYKYTKWEDIFEKGLGLVRKPGSNLNLSWSRALKGEISFEEMIQETYNTRGLDIKSQAYAIYMESLRLREGCIDLLEFLSSKYPLVVCSDTSGITKKLVQRFGLEKYFSAFLYSCDVGYVKSDRRFWRRLLGCFPNLRTDEFAIVGDNPKADVRWPKALGMRTILIQSTELHIETNHAVNIYRPHVYVRALSDVYKIFRNKSLE